MIWELAKMGFIIGLCISLMYIGGIAIIIIFKKYIL